MPVSGAGVAKQKGAAAARHHAVRLDRAAKIAADKYFPAVPKSGHKVIIIRRRSGGIIGTMTAMLTLCPDRAGHLPTAENGPIS